MQSYVKIKLTQQTYTKLAIISLGLKLIIYKALCLGLCEIYQSQSKMPVFKKFQVSRSKDTELPTMKKCINGFW